ncbi:hypothetical protein [Actinomadura bangladeshensis]|uniref:Uncharacterized protein n=1 Tax=Actinomadura bangladeshensis TaxID=453573 RepID=A0A4R4NSQ1_9ACTN|nr:hypothetical protein [Actinomadura bangladeshensis]TDC12701.1 hypothetical protein E1284_22495 [Actinomadura bangladeshensis]
MGLEALEMFSKFDLFAPGDKTKVSESTRQKKVVEAFKEGLEQSLKNPSRVHGWRAQALFEAVIIALGSVTLIKTEDAGSYYYDDTDGSVRLPDFRIVACDGENLLVEVKTVRPQAQTHSIRERDLEAQLRYAQLTGSRLLVAHYWAMVNMWTIVDANVLQRNNGRASISFESASMANEFVFLGDAMVGTIPPLTFSVLADKTKPRVAGPIKDEQRSVEFTIGGVELISGQNVLVDELEQRIAWFLMLYGNWEVEQILRIEEEGGNRIDRIDTVTTPPSPDRDAAAQISEQGFALVGYLSSMYSSLWNAATLTDEGDVRRLRQEPDPGVLAELIPPDYWERESSLLPIWLLQIGPSFGPSVSKEIKLRRPWDPNSGRRS